MSDYTSARVRITNPRLAQLGREARQQKKEQYVALVSDLLVKGIIRSNEIQKVLEGQNPPIHISISSIIRYKTLVYKRNRDIIRSKEGITKTVEEVALDIKNTFDMVTKEMWLQYHNPLTGSKTKATLLSSIRETCVENVKLMQSLGLMYERPDQTQYLDKDGNPTDAPDVNLMVLNNQFNAFIKAQYQLPLGVKEKE